LISLKATIELAKPSNKNHLKNGIFVIGLYSSFQHNYLQNNSQNCCSIFWYTKETTNIMHVQKRVLCTHPKKHVLCTSPSSLWVSLRDDFNHVG